MATSVDPSNQRSSPRLPAPSTVWLQCRRSDSGRDLANGLLDLSAGGLQILAREPLTVGDLLDITFSSANRFSSVRCQGTVCWVVPLGSTACFAGVRLHEPLADEDLASMCAAREEVPAAAALFDEASATPDAPFA
jgi:hypothetical protein